MVSLSISLTYTPSVSNLICLARKVHSLSLKLPGEFSWALDIDYANLHKLASCFASDNQPEILDAHGYRGLDIGLLVGCPFRLHELSHSKTMGAIRPSPMEVNKLLSEERDIRSWRKLSPFIPMDALPRLRVDTA